ncbi:MAG: putative sugar O-methyltransferase [Anaerolineales bacterium]
MPLEILSQVKQVLRNVLRKYGFEITPSSTVFDWQIDGNALQRAEPFLPEGAREYLRADNPQLLDLQSRYQDYDNYPYGEVFLWTPDRIKPEDILYFRGHNAYLFQEGRLNRNPFGYLLAYYYVKSLDRYHLLETLEEDNAFGAISYHFDSRDVSRDLLDSILEIYFLDEHLGVMSNTNLTVLDIGAGYGRLAFRMAQGIPGLREYCCTDAVPESTFLSDYYLNFRGTGEKTRVIPIDRVYQEITPGTIDLAVNIHCFSEMTLPAIEWWMDLLDENRVPAIMIVPNSKTGLLTNDRVDFQPLVEDRGYRLAVRQPKYSDPVVQRYALNPDFFHLFLRD